MHALIPYFVVLPLACAFLVIIFGNAIKGFSKALTSLVLLLLTGLSIALMVTCFSGVYKIGGWEPVNGIPIGIYFVVDGLSLLLLTIINLIGFFSAFYSIAYIRKYTGERNFYALFNLMVAGMSGVVLSGDIFNLYVFVEISAIASYALVAFGIKKQELEASLKYQMLGGIASMMILLSIALLYWQTKTLNLADISRALKEGTNQHFLVFVQTLLITGFGLKSAMVPFHSWLPDAHSSAPSPISSMLSGVLIKAIGIYVLFRLFFNMFTVSLEFAWVITILGVLSMIIGALLSIYQNDIKRLLAYSSISQVGYILLGVGIGMIIIARNGNVNIAALAIMGGLFHLLNHAVFKGLLFLNAGAIEHQTGIRDLNELGGLHEDMSITSVSSFSASMAIAGIPPFNGFFSKLVIIIAAVQGGFYTLAALAVIISFVTLAIFLKFQKQAFMGKLKIQKKISEVPFSMSFSMIIMALLCLLMSLLIIPGLREYVLTPAVDVLLYPMNYSVIVLGL